MKTTISQELQQAAPFEGGTVSKKSNRGLVIITIVLLIILLFLAYLYWLMARPPTAAKVPKTPGITHLFSIYGWGKHRLRHPESVALDKYGNIYVADTGRHRLVSFDRNGRFRFVAGERSVRTGVKPKELLLPLGVAVNDKNGDIYVTMFDFGKIMVFNRYGKYKSEFTLPKRPVRIKYRKGKLYITHSGGIIVTDLRGLVLKSWGIKGKLIGQFEMPTGIDFDSKGHLFVSDTENMRIQILDKRGRVVGGIGRPPRDMNDSDRLFGLPAGLTLDNKENVYLVDSFNHQIRVFDHDGNDKGRYGKQGSLDGMFNYPSDIVYAGGDVFVIADKWNSRIQVLRITPKGGGGTGRAKVGKPGIGWQIPAIILALILLITAWYWNRRRNARLSKSPVAA